MFGAFRPGKLGLRSEACAETGLPKGRTELRGWGLAVADLNRDGRPDIAAGFGRNSAGSLEVWVQR